MNSSIVSFFSELTNLEINSFYAFLIFGIACFLMVNVSALIGGLGTYAERKISADLQMRHGPNRVGPFGILQFLADGVKLLLKEIIVPTQADKVLFLIAPLLCLAGVFATLAVLPISSGLILTDLNIGILYILGVSSIVGVGIFLGGYSSNSKWSMLGGMRGAAQIISYEVPVTLCIISIVLMAGGLSMTTLVSEQGGLPHEWYIFHNPFAFIGFFVFFIGILAESNRAPFDLPEAESELVSGYHTEYSGMAFSFFALAEYVEVFVLCGITATLYLGGYKVPLSLGDGVMINQLFGAPEFVGKSIGQLLQLGSFFTKTFLLYYVVIWIRWTLPRLRVDQLVSLCWKYLTPIALVNLIGIAAWEWIFKGHSIFNLISSLLHSSGGGGH